MAIDGDTVVVGADGDGDAWSGSVYVYRTTDGGATYDLVVKLRASDAGLTDMFGISVAIDGGTIVVGAMNEGPGWVHGTGYYQGYGAVYVFRTTDGWTTHTEIKLTAADVAEGDNFGRSVAIDGNNRRGRSLRRGNRRLRLPPHGRRRFHGCQGISGTHCGEGDAAGRRVLVPSALAGTRCCGSIYDSFCNNDNDLCLNGAAPGYVTYEVAKATCEDAGARLCTPDELELSENEGGAKGTGCNFNFAYVWSSEAGATYDQVARLTAADAAAGDLFGQSVAIAGGTIVVRAYNTDTAYVFRTSDGGATYGQVAKLTAARRPTTSAAGRRHSMATPCRTGWVQRLPHDRRRVHGCQGIVGDALQRGRCCG